MKRLGIVLFILFLMGFALNSLTYATGETLQEGFAGLPWGSKPEQAAGITPVRPGCPPYLIYRLQPDPQDPIFGKASVLALVFSPKEGLIQGWLAFPKDSAPILLLWQYLGPQAMIEPLPGHPVKATWFPGKNTRVEEDDKEYLFSCRDASELLDGASIRLALSTQK
jgi:hypothetical protein